MNPEKLYSEIRDYCIENANEQVLISAQRYFKNGYNGYGLKSQQIKDKVKELLMSKKLNLNLVFDCFFDYLIKKNLYEEITFGLLLIDGLSKNFSKESFQKVQSMFDETIDNWAHADTLGMFILPKFLLNDIADLLDFEDWIYSPYKFQRRCVPVTFIKHMKKNKDFSTLIKITEPLMTDRDREVHQGMGWFLREAWKVTPEPVENFLLKWKDAAPRLIIQYACEKMTLEQKAHYKKGK